MPKLVVTGLWFLIAMVSFSVITVWYINFVAVIRSNKLDNIYALIGC